MVSSRHRTASIPSSFDTLGPGHHGGGRVNPDFKVLNMRRITSQTFVLRTEKPPVPIRAGQCFSVGTRDLGINREYSMYSAASDPFVDFLIRKVDGGAVSERLERLDSGDAVQIGGPYGSFCLDETAISTRSFVFIASGTGIAPFASYVATYPDLDYTIFHGVRHEDEQYDQDRYDSVRYRPCISRPQSGAGQRVTDALSRVELQRDSLYYLCGNRDMITDVVQLLREKGIPGGSIFMETFF